MTLSARSPESKTPICNRIASRAFTLVELLVTIMVVAILAAILFPVIGSVRESVNQTECVSNMRQLGIASHLYLSDNRNVMYPHSYWSTYLDPYLQDVDINEKYNWRDYIPHCPTVESELPENVRRLGYGKNAYLGMLPSGGATVRINDAYESSNVVLMWDDTNIRNYDGGWPTATWGSGGSWYELAFRHKGCCHVLMLDGHVQSLEEIPGGSHNATDYPELNWGPFPNYPQVRWPN